MLNFDDYTNENKIEHDSKWPHLPDHPYRILIKGGSGSEKTNALLNLINNQQDIDKIYPYAKDPYEAKYQYLINKRGKVGLNYFKDPKAFMEYPNDMEDVYKNIENYNQGKKRKILIVFDDMISDMINNKKLNPVVTELFITTFDTTLPSDDPLRFRKNLLDKHIIKIITIKDQIRDEKLQYVINREAAKI